MPAKKPAFKMPSWYYMARSVSLLFIGIVMVLHETVFQQTPVRVLVIVAAFLLMGFSAADIAALWGRANSESGNS
jgi:uncharacterized protein YqgC (DUF456 family)